MIAASVPIQRDPRAKLLVVDACGRMIHAPRAALADFLCLGDLVVANDAATLPASLGGVHVRSGEVVEARLAGSRALRGEAATHFIAIVFGAGDFRTRTEDRPPPPDLRAGDVLKLGPLRAIVERTLDHPRLVALRFAGTPASIWDGIARHGRPIQYAHVQTPLALWDVWTPIAGAPFAFEPPSAGFVLDWSTLASIRARGVAFATITHAAGISSTGDPALDRRLPFDEPYRISYAAAQEIRRAKQRGRRVVAIGTTVVRALEHAAARDGIVRPGDGVATQSIGADTSLRVVDAVVSGAHEPGTSHYELLRAFADDATLRDATAALDAAGYRTHEFGDSVLISARSRARTSACPPARRPFVPRQSSVSCPQRYRRRA